MKGIMYDLKMKNIVLTKTHLPGTRPMVKYRKDWQIPAIKYPNQVQVKTRLGGICATDLHQIALKISYFASIFTMPASSFPMGHEFVGEVSQTGGNAIGFHAGERVVYCPIATCEAYGFRMCPSCRTGDLQGCACLAGVGDGTELEDLYGGRGGFRGYGGGGFCEYSIGFEKQYFRVPKGIADEIAVLTEPFAVAIHAVSRNLPSDDQTVLVIGAGIIGLMTIAAIKALGSKCRIITLAHYPFQAETAKFLGSDIIISERDKDRLYKRIVDLSGGQLFKPMLGKKAVFGHTALGTIFDCVASEASMDDALHLISSNGKIVVVGLGYTKTKKIDWSIQVYKEVNIVGTLGYGMEPYEGGVHHAFELAFIFFQRTPNLFKNLVTHRFPIDRYKAAFRCAANKGPNRAIKVSFDFR